MKIEVSAKLMLVVAIALLAANLVVMFAVNGARPAHAAERTCVGIAACSYTVQGGVQQWGLWKAFSDGQVQKVQGDLGY